MKKQKMIKNYFYNYKTDLLYINIFDKEGEAHLVIKSVNSQDKVDKILKNIELKKYFIYRDIYSNQVKLAMSPNMIKYQSRI